MPASSSNQNSMWFLLLFALTVSVEAGTVQGVVIEHASSRPLARTIVRLDPVPGSTGSAGKPLMTRSGRSGHFVFSPAPPGLYLLTAVREGYFPASYGQRFPAGRGEPISVSADSTLIAEMRMRHKGALTGRVLDENGVGAPRVPVVAYRAVLPLRTAGGATSDDRGVFRIAGLDPGKYWVRSGAHTLEDGSGWGPTFGPQSREVRYARLHQVTVDADAAYADVSPEPGPLYSVGGWIVCEKPGTVLVTLSSETGQQSSQTLCGPAPGSYQFKGLSVGNYELRATAENGSASAFSEFTLAAGLQLNLSLLSSPDVLIEVWRAGAGAVGDIPIRLSGRLQTLSETGSAVDIRGPRTTVAPGHWEFRAVVPDGYYVDSIASSSSSRQGRGNVGRSSNGFDVFIEPQRPSRIRVTLSDQAGKITGSVKSQGKPAPGAPVFLWPVAESARRSLGGAVQRISDTEGSFHFDNLPPGDYRILASFDANDIDDELAELSRAPVVHCNARQSTSVDLALWIAPF